MATERDQVKFFLTTMNILARRLKEKYSGQKLEIYKSVYMEIVYKVDRGRLYHFDFIEGEILASAVRYRETIKVEENPLLSEVYRTHRKAYEEVFRIAQNLGKNFKKKQTSYDYLDFDNCLEKFAYHRFLQW